MFTMIFAIIMVIAVSIPCVSAATSELVTTKKVSFTAECSKPGYEFSVYKIADLKTTSNPYSVKYDVKISSGEVRAAISFGSTLPTGTVSGVPARPTPPTSRSSRWKK